VSAPNIPNRPPWPIPSNIERPLSALHWTDLISTRIESASTLDTYRGQPAASAAGPTM